MDRLDAMSVIVAVAEAGSFSAASRKLGMSIATISRNVGFVEARLKTELFRRSNRGLTLSSEGRDYVEACKQIVEQVDDAERKASGEYRNPRGDLVVTAPWGLGHTYLLPLTVEFLNLFPEIGLRLLLTDRVVDPSNEGVDIAIRIGALSESSMIAARIGSVRIVVCGSPAYLEARGRPETPDQLGVHDCIAINPVSSVNAWMFRRGKREYAVPIRSRLSVNTSEAAVLAVIAGAGLARVMSYKMDEARRTGSLDIVLARFEPEVLPIHFVYSPRKPMPLKYRVFLDWMTPRLKARLTFSDGQP